MLVEGGRKEGAGVQENYLKYYAALRGNLGGHFNFLTNYLKHNIILVRNVP